MFVCNGSTVGEDATSLPLPAEIYNPATNSWSVDATPQVPRVYHSVALLLPDGRVVTAGGNRWGVNELRIEMYSPWYMTQRGRRFRVRRSPRHMAEQSGSRHRRHPESSGLA